MPQDVRDFLRPLSPLSQALYDTAARLEQQGTDYQWGHFGLCNLGHLAQTVSKCSSGALQRAACMRGADWEDVMNDYCPTSGKLLDDVIDRLLALGMNREELGQLEKLSNPRVIARLQAQHQDDPEKAAEMRHPQRNNRAHVIAYMRAWASLV